LSEFQIDRDRALALIEPRFSDQDLAGMKLEALSCIIDYGWLSDAYRSDRPASTNTPQPTDLGNWSFFEDFISGGSDQSLDPVGQGMNTFMNGRSGRMRDWWPDEAGDHAEADGQLLEFTL